MVSLPEIIIPLKFEGTEWLAELEGTRLCASELEELEERIYETLCQTSHYNGYPAIQVWLGFDFSSLPVWLRQYHAHYFNYRFTIRLPMNKQENDLEMKP